MESPLVTSRPAACARVRGWRVGSGWSCPQPSEPERELYVQKHTINAFYTQITPAERRGRSDRAVESARVGTVC
ncbi:hypothetical protein SRHO_G00111010 [Serrasalmus rhombeus]